MCWNIHWAVDRDDSQHPTIARCLYSAAHIAAGACCDTEGTLIEIKLCWATSHLIWLNAKQTRVTSILIIRKPMTKMKMIPETFVCACLTSWHEWQPKRHSLHLALWKFPGSNWLNKPSGLCFAFIDIVVKATWPYTSKITFCKLTNNRCTLQF